ncbi:MAG: trypsin-like peptidase domain-containing protein [Synechococcus sp.]
MQLLVSAATLALPFMPLAFGTLLRAAPATQALITPRSFVAEAIQRSGPAVVTLEINRTVQEGQVSGLPRGLTLDPALQRLLKTRTSQMPRSWVQVKHSSGLIFDASGLVLTNAHVVENAENMTVGLPDGRRVSGRVLGRDRLTDLAVIRLDGDGPWPTAPLGDSDALQVGDWAIAVGNPFGLDNTVTLGIISNLNRNVSQLGIFGMRLDLIQTDAAINPGNSGGPLLNAAGEVVGINTLVRSGPGAGLSFAIPINRAHVIALQLASTGRVSHPIVGITLSSVPAPEPGTPRPYGAVVRSVEPKGPADLAGVEVDDVIVSIADVSIKTPSDVVTAIDRNGVNRPVDFEVQRGSRRLSLTMTPTEMAEFQPQR